METIIKDRPLRNTQSLICNYIDADVKEQKEELISLYHSLNHENAEEIGDKAEKLIFRPESNLPSDNVIYILGLIYLIIACLVTMGYSILK